MTKYLSSGLQDGSVQTTTPCGGSISPAGKICVGLLKHTVLTAVNVGLVDLQSRQKMGPRSRVMLLETRPLMLLPCKGC